MNWETSNQYRHRCSCGKFTSMNKRYGWEACGEYGEETRYICSSCLDNGYQPQASNGSKDAKWCGIRNS